jgi:hypothetical protein
MNVLLLTPDAVGSTLLQRLITIYMQFHQFDHPVINLHELTNGLEKYYSADFNREILGRASRVNKDWGYYQSLNEIVNVLSSVDHYKTARLAEYHIKNRQDHISDQVPFYQYLNNNFFIIACRRRNLFEHALSWGLNNITKKLNVFSADEKISSFYDIYKNQVDIDLVGFEKSLNRYSSYLSWCDDHFSIGSYFYYEDHVNDLEKYILNLPIFNSQHKKISWHDTYDISLKDWNQTHYYLSNIGSLALENPKKLLLLENSTIPAVENTPEYALLGPDQCKLLTHLPAEQKDHIKLNLKKYQSAADSIHHMLKLGILVSAVPIKKQTLAEKKFMIKNFDQCIKIYNSWAVENPAIAQTITPDELDLMIANDLETWNTVNQSDSKSSSPLLPPID